MVTFLLTLSETQLSILLALVSCVLCLLYGVVLYLGFKKYPDMSSIILLILVCVFPLTLVPSIAIKTLVSEYSVGVLNQKTRNSFTGKIKDRDIIYFDGSGLCRSNFSNSNKIDFKTLLAHSLLAKPKTCDNSRCQKGFSIRQCLDSLSRFYY